LIQVKRKDKMGPKKKKGEEAVVEQESPDQIEWKGLKVEAGTFVLQVGKRKFARVTLA
jgi:hypothetical protein